jgi:hypothetical protein
MHPVQHFKANFAQDEAGGSAADTWTGFALDGPEQHETDSHVRNVCFMWEDGRRAFFNYAYLVSVDLTLQESGNVMLLCFSGQIVTLKGYHLDLLFDLLVNHSPKVIAASNPRYLIDDQNSAVVVTEIVVKNE